MNLLDIDSNGFVINNGDRKLVQPEFEQLVVSLQDLCTSTFDKYLVSLYIRGSVSVGKAYIGTSDLDSVVLLVDEPTETDKSKSQNIVKILERDHPEVTMVDLTVVSVDKLLYSSEWKNLRVNMKTQSALLFGKDIVKHLSGIKPGKELALMMFGGVLNELVELHQIFKNNTVREYQGVKKNIQFWCIWTCRVILRSSMGIVMANTPLFSPELTTCNEIFSKRYPEFADDMNQILKWAFKPPTSNSEISAFLDNFIPKYSILWSNLKN